ncbi:MAG TPA: hypothetical protein VIL97_02905, partial [Thermoanaerobaculia bacterium]
MNRSLAMVGLASLAWFARRRPLVVFPLFFALGIAVASWNARGHREASAVPADRFVTVSAPIGRGWEEGPHRRRLEAHEFDLEGTSVNAPLSIYLPSTAPEVGQAARIVAEGFLSKSDRDTYSLSVKSSRLIRYEGTLSLAHPV